MQGPRSKDKFRVMEEMTEDHGEVKSKKEAEARLFGPLLFFFKF